MKIIRRIILFSLTFVSLGVLAIHMTRYIPFETQSSIQYRLPARAPQGSFYRAGVAAAVITPSAHTLMAGFDPRRVSVGVQRDLEVRTLALAAPSGEIYVFVTADLIGFLHEDVARLRQHVPVAGVQIFVMSSHTHAGPDMVGIWGYPPFVSGRSEKYVDEVIDQMAKTVMLAIDRLEAVNVSTASIAAPGLSQNGRESNFIDRELSLLFFESLVRPGKFVGIIANFGCHPEVMGSKNRFISPDFVGAARSNIDKAFDTTTLFVNGALGGMVSPGGEWKAVQKFENLDRWGERFSGYAVQAAPKKVRIDPAATVFHQRVDMRLPMHNKQFIAALTLGLIPKSHDFLWSGKISTELNVLKIGQVTIVMVPGEIVPELGLRIKNLYGPGTQVWSLANDEIGYILVDEKFHTPLFKYERTMSLGPKTGSLIMHDLERLASEKKENK